MTQKRDAKRLYFEMVKEIAWCIEKGLTGESGDYFAAKLAGIAPSDVSDVAIKIAMQEVKDALNFSQQGKPGREWVYAIIAKHLTRRTEL